MKRRGIPVAGRHLTVTFLAVSVLLATAVCVPSGSAAELGERREEVQGEITEAHRHLDQSSARLTAAEDELASAEAALSGARAALTQTRERLAGAEALDRRMQTELARAIEDVSRARIALAEGRSSLSRQIKALRAIAASHYTSQSSELMTLATVFSTQDTTQVAGQLLSQSSVLNVEAANLAKLEASQILLETQRTAYEEAQREVAQKRAAAAANLAEKQQLETAAAATVGQIQSLMARRLQARGAAVRAKTEDARHLEQLEVEKADIAELLRRRAEQARAEAEARARADAATGQAPPHADGDAPSAADPQRDEPVGSQPPAPAAPPPPPPAGSTMVAPVDGYLTSSYGMRFHPIYQLWKLHDGTDFGASCGTPVRASASGTVVATYYGGGYGDRIILDHGLLNGVGVGTTYNHLSGYATSVGDYVQQGEIIGYVGTTGASTGCHLHFMVFEDGVTVDPMSWL